MSSQTSTSAATSPSWKSRIACLFYEVLVVLAIIIVGLIIPYTLLGAAIGIVAGSRLLLAHLFLILLLYFSWQWLHGGQTLAMKTWRIKLVSADGKAIRPAQALLRYAAAWLGTIFFGIGFLWAAIDQEGRYLHDRLAGTKLDKITPP